MIVAEDCVVCSSDYHGNVDSALREGLEALIAQTARIKLQDIVHIRIRVMNADLPLPRTLRAWRGYIHGAHAKGYWWNATKLQVEYDYPVRASEVPWELQGVYYVVWTLKRLK